MPDPTTWTTDVTALLVHPDDSAVWLHAGTTPFLRFRHEGYLWFPGVAPVIDVVRERWGIDAIVLRCVDRTMDRTNHHQRLAFLMQLRSSNAPPSGSWTSMATLALPGDPCRDALLAALRDIDAPVSPTRRPWTARGWFDDAVDWAGEALNAAGLDLLGPPRQIRAWDLSTVIRCDTTGGPFYFKAAVFAGAGSARSILFANEAALLRALSERCLAYGPIPLAVDSDRVWLLLPDVGVHLVDRPDLDLWEEAFRLHARHQRSWAGQQGALFQAGCLDRRLSRMAEQIDAVVSDETLLRDMEPSERVRTRSSAPAFHAMLAELSALGIPETLVHGDLHAENIALRDDRLTFFDWTDAAVSHPFLDLVIFTHESEFIDSVPGARERLISAYLDEWRGVAPEASLRRAAALAQPLSMLYQAISYQHMLPDLDEPGLTAMTRGGMQWLALAVDALATT